MGAKKYDRVNRSAVYCIITSGVLVGSAGAVCTIFGRQLLSIYNPNPEIISKGMERAIAVFLSYGLCAIMDSISGTLRGMGKSFGPMLLSIFGVCFVRIVWVWSIFRLHKTLSMLMLSYPVSYAITIVLTGWMLKKELAKKNNHQYVETAKFFFEIGMHCLGCPHSRGESIEEACIVHGTNADELVKKINDYLASK